MENSEHPQPETPAVAVFGATGHTGRFVVAELSRRGLQPIAIARNAEVLATANFSGANVDRRHATIDDDGSLDRALSGAQAVINCAGPFIDTAGPVASAAIRAKIHYLDVCAEQQAAKEIFANYHEPAQRAGIVAIPSMAFYGGLPDLIVSATLADWPSADSIEIMIALDSWHPTKGTRITIGKLAPPLVVTDGELVPVPSSPGRESWNFGSKFGEQTLVDVPFSEMMLIPRHVQVGHVRTYINSSAVIEVLDAGTPTPKASDDSGRSPQRFAMEVHIKRGSESRTSSMSGRDIYAFTAPLICEAVERLLKGTFAFAGVYAPSEVLDAHDFLAAFNTADSNFEIKSPA